MAEIIAHDVGIEFSINRKQRKTTRDLFIHGRRSRSADTFWAVRNINFEIGAGEVVGLIGNNGSGKTTLLKMIAGVLIPDEGSLETTGEIVSMLSLGAGFSPELTAAENIYLTGAIYGMSKAQIDERFDHIVDFSGIGQFLETPLKHFSSGMRVRLGFSVIKEINNPIVLLDEVLGVGDHGFRRKVFRHMRQMSRDGRTQIIVTHRPKHIKRLCSRAMVMEKGKLIFDGPTEDGMQMYRSTAGTGRKP